MKRAVIVYVGCSKINEVEEYLKSWGFNVKSEFSDLDFQTIEEKLFELAEEKVQLLITIGGIGLTKEDTVPEAVLSLIDKRLHGLEFILLNDEDPRIPIFRSVVGMRRRTLILTLPDNFNLAKKMLDRAKKSVLKALEVLEGNEEHC